jgi:hypothetical protein
VVSTLDHVAAERLDRCADREMVVLTKAQARKLTETIKGAVSIVWDLIAKAYTERAWSALGYSSWDAYCDAEFGTSRLRLPREERAEVVASLRESGLSIRAIASATGHGVATIKRELDSRVPNGTPEPVDVDVVDEVGDRSVPGGLRSTSPGQTDRVQDALERARQTPIIGRDGKTLRRSTSDLRRTHCTTTEFNTTARVEG